MPKVSVIIPCYNHGRFLARCVGSVRAQTFTDHEIVVIDDGSTDETAEVARRLGVRLVSQENRGLSGARNAGLSRATGEYIVFMDADNLMEPTFLQTCVGVLEADPAAVAVYCGSAICDEEGERIRVASRVVPPEGLYSELLLGGFLNAQLLLRMAAVRELGGFDEELRAVEDTDLWLRLSHRRKIVGIEAPLIRCCMTAGSLSTQQDLMHRSGLRVLAKQLGPLESAATAEARRAYGHRFRGSAIGWLRGGRPEKAIELLVQAIELWPPLFSSLDTYFEIACGEQAREHRGMAERLDLDERLERIRELVGAVAERVPRRARPSRRAALAQGLLALAMLADEAGDWSRGRRYLARALVADPRLAAAPGVARRALKLLAGKRLVAWLAGRRRPAAAAPARS